MQPHDVQREPVAQAAPGPRAVPEPAAPSARGFREWLTRRAALARALREHAQREDERAWLARGGNALRAADRLLDPPDGSLPEPALALSLYRESCLWLLCAAGVGAPERGLGALLARASEAPVGHAPRPEPAAVDALAADSAAFAQLNEAEQAASARAAQRWLGRLLDQLELDAGEVLRLRFERAVRASALLLVLTALTAGVALAVIEARRGPDLAAGKPWRASSSYAQCQPLQRWCADSRTAIFFHTKEDDVPWFEVDLGSVQRISRVEVKNRSDYGPDRAVPLVVEVSADGRAYWPVAHRAQVFDVWNASFAPRKARYVRLTVQRKSFLHLERVSVRR